MAKSNEAEAGCCCEMNKNKIYCIIKAFLCALEHGEIDF